MYSDCVPMSLSIFLNININDSQYCIEFIYPELLNQFLGWGCLEWLQFLTTINYATVNIVQLFFVASFSIFWGWMPKNGIWKVHGPFWWIVFKNLFIIYTPNSRVPFPCIFAKIGHYIFLFYFIFSPLSIELANAYILLFI